MSKAEILEEVSRLGPEDRREILEELCELEERDLLKGGGPTSAEKALLDREFEEFRLNPQAGSSWETVEARLRKSSKQ